MILTFVRQPLNADDSPVYPGLLSYLVLLSRCLVTAVIGCFTPIHRPPLGSSLHALNCLRHGGRFRLSQSILLTREFTLLEICMIYHQAEQVSQQGSLISLARNRNESSARYVCSARVNLSCWQVELVMSESTGSRSKMICSEMFVFCSGLLVSLTFGVSCQRSRLSEIRWLNVKQPTSTRLRLGLDHDQDWTGLDSDSDSDSIRTGLDHDLRTRDSIRLSSRGELNLISNEAGSTGPSRVLSRLSDISKRSARLALSESSSPPLRPELREFPAKTLDARPSRPVVEC